MRTIKCIGYEGHECGKTVRATNNYQKRCPACAKEANRKTIRKYKNTPKGRKTQRKYQRTPKGRKTKRKADRKFSRTPKGRKASRKAAWKRWEITMKNGSPLTVEIFDRDAKKGCRFKSLWTYSSGTLHADHDHETGAYRGPLCKRHNIALGALGDMPESLRQAANILENKS